MRKPFKIYRKSSINSLNEILQKATLRASCVKTENGMLNHLIARIIINYARLMPNIGRDELRYFLVFFVFRWPGRNSGEIMAVISLVVGDGL